MNWKKIITTTILIAVVALVVIKLATNKKIAQNKVYEYDKEQKIAVETLVVKLENRKIDHSFSGTFEPFKETKLSAEIQGKVNHVLVDVGSIVKKGQTLLQIDNALLKLQVQQIDVQIEGMEADMNRYKILAEADAIQGIQLEKTQLTLKTTKVQKAILLEQINKTTIKAPFSGVVTAKLCEEGAFAGPGMALLQITDISRLKFTANVAENDLDKFNPQTSYLISVDAFSALQLYGKTTLIGSKANLGNSFPIQLTVNNTKDLKIKSGMFGHIFISTSQEGKHLLIPSSAIIGNSDQPQVYLVKNGRAIIQNITTSQNIGNSTVVTSGIKEGDLVITSGFVTLFDGAQVNIQ